MQITGVIGHQPGLVEFFVLGCWCAQRDEARELSREFQQAMTVSRERRRIKHENPHLRTPGVDDQGAYRVREGRRVI